MDTKLIQYAQIYDVPTVCKICGGVLVYRGLGEYRCGKEIRSGRYCQACENDIHLTIERQQREKLRENMQGFALEKSGEKGQRRFVRDK